ncbi:hypothetical protein [Variovorax sp. N23]|uniref:hypothetical protein n=1 Tax=Variovorax sp. N23 TaxID=2980555 RepID=UPI0021C931C8|nr:hypothetical protein [Variovorax sp. N23]MCU4119279.1 hypothetical protein [Variovorax sp. N23]
MITTILANWKLIAVGLLLAALASALGVQAVRLAGARGALADEKAARAQETNDRLRAALRESERVAALQLTHATTQQEIVDAYETRLETIQDGRNSDAADSQRVRRQLAAFAARDRETARSDPAACERVADRSAVLADVAAEGRDLLAEGRRVVEGRDAEVTLLLGLVRNDRALLAPVDYTLPASGRLRSP